MQISSNILLKIIVPVVLLVVIMVSVKSCDDTQSAQETTNHSSIIDLTQEELGKALSGGSNEIAEWVKARYGQMFDAIYVPPGAPVAVHITRAIPIDYEAQGRKVKYDFDISQQNELD